MVGGVCLQKLAEGGRLRHLYSVCACLFVSLCVQGLTFVYDCLDMCNYVIKCMEEKRERETNTTT